MSPLTPSEISSVLKEKISGLDLSAERKNEGIIVIAATNRADISS